MTEPVGFIVGLIVGAGVAMFAVRDHCREKRARPPALAEQSAHHLGLVDGLQEAEGILSFVASWYEKSPSGSIWASDALEKTRGLILDRRLYYQGELDRGAP